MTTIDTCYALFIDKYSVYKWADRQTHLMRYYDVFKNASMSLIKSKHMSTPPTNGHNLVIFQPILKNFRCFGFRKLSSFR